MASEKVELHGVVGLHSLEDHACFATNSNEALRKLNTGQTVVFSFQRLALGGDLIMSTCLFNIFDKSPRTVDSFLEMHRSKLFFFTIALHQGEGNQLLVIVSSLVNNLFKDTSQTWERVNLPSSPLINSVPFLTLQTKLN